MKLKKMLLIILIILTLPSGSECEEYTKLEVKNVASIKKSDLPEEFSDEAFEVVDEFIRKTADLNYEIVIFFDYITGEILKCKIGSKNNVIIKFDENKFENHHVASIHNHTKDMYSPPSDKNFGIFSREWEEYELIAARDCLWILKGKIKDENLIVELRRESSKIFISSFHYYYKKYGSKDIAFEKCDMLYGKRLSNYINNKNQKEIQLIKKEYE